MYQIYRLISILVYPFIKLLLKKRISKGKEDPVRFKEKLGIYKLNRPKGRLIWFHAASIGEFNAILPIIKNISEAFPKLNILVTTVTLTSAKLAANNLPKNAFHQFAPLDCDNIVRKFINYWQPNLVIWTESEFWPNLLYRAKDQAKVLLINARLSEKSYRRWSYAKALARLVLNCFSLILAQNEESKVFIEKLGIKDVINSGNLKFIAANFSYNQQDFKKLEQELQNRIVVMAASTHPGEEEIFIKIQANLKFIYPKLLMIIAPRHPERKSEVIDKINIKHLNFVTRSSEVEVTPNTDILLVDTIGEFGLFYRLTKIVAMGGSWCKIGHNFIEPAKLRNIIIFGPRMDNSREVAELFLERKAAILAENQESIQQVIEEYIINPKNFFAIQDNAESTVNEMEKVQEVVMNSLRPFLSDLER